MKIIDIVEARRNPEQNPRINPLDWLKNIANTYDNVFVTFNTVDKFGIYPSSAYNTPIGIYSYPVNYVIDHELRVPFPKGVGVSKSYYMYVFSEPKNNSVLNLEEPNDKFSLEQLIKIMPRFVKEATPETIKAVYQDYAQKYHVIPLAKNFDELDLDLDHVPGTLAPFQNKALWHSIYNLLGEYSDQDNLGLYARKILQEMGFSGVYDPGYGIIHENEVTQAVFFKATDLNVIDRIFIPPAQPQPLTYNINYFKNIPQNASVEVVLRNLRMMKITYRLTNKVDDWYSKKLLSISSMRQITDDLNHFIGTFSFGNDIITKSRIILMKRMPKTMSVIMKRPMLAANIAVNVLYGRWPEAEPFIMKTPTAKEYYKYVLLPNEKI